MNFLSSVFVCTAAAVAVGYHLESTAAGLAIWLVVGCTLIWLSSNEKTE